MGNCEESMRKLKILIISHFFPPLNKIGSLRPLSWAKYWTKMEHDVRVLTTRKETFDGVLNLQIAFGESKCVVIEEVPYWPFKTRDYYINENSYKRNTSGPTPAVMKIKRIVRNLRRFVGSFPNIHDLWIIPGLRKALEIYKQWPFEVVVSSYGPTSPHIIAGILKRKLGVFWVADYRDLWHGNHIASAKWPLRYNRKLWMDG